MNLINEKVEHVKFGQGIIIEANDDTVVVQFQEEVGEKGFLYPEAFEKFLKAVDSTVEDYISEESHEKQEKLKLEREAAEVEYQEAKVERLAKKKSESRSRKKA